MAVELEPRPDDIGTRMSQWMRRPAGAGLPASSHRRRNARATRLVSSRGSPAGSGPSTVTTMSSPSTENRTSFHRSSASPRQSKPGPMLAVVAGTLTRQVAPGARPARTHASSPYSVSVRVRRGCGGSCATATRPRPRPAISAATTA